MLDFILLFLFIYLVAKPPTFFLFKENSDLFLNLYLVYVLLMSGWEKERKEKDLQIKHETWLMIQVPIFP